MHWRSFIVMGILVGYVAVGVLPCQGQPNANGGVSIRPAEQAELIEQTGWQTVAASGQPTARHEAAWAAVHGKLYLIGGRRINPVDVFDPETNRWSAASKSPLELHHFQAVVVEDSIYMIGAMTGGYPAETPLEKIVVYHPQQDRFDFVHTIPKSRRRGGAGAALYDGKIYIVGGITNGHIGGFVPWLDVYDPKTGDWLPLPDAPHARDHFQAVVVEDKLYAFAGRTTSQKTKQVFDLTVDQCDVFDLTTKTWQIKSPPNLPTPRAGNMAIAIENHVIIGGGESTQRQAHSDVEGFDCVRQTWSTLPALKRGRHGTGFAVVGDHLYTASGSGRQGGRPELFSIERIRIAELIPKE